MTNDERIQQAAKEHYPHITPLQEPFTLGAKTESAHWQPILAEKDLAIEELVKGLGEALSYLDEDSPRISDKISQLINKYKKP